MPAVLRLRGAAGAYARVDMVTSHRRREFARGTLARRVGHIDRQLREIAEEAEQAAHTFGDQLSAARLAQCIEGARRQLAGVWHFAPDAYLDLIASLEASGPDSPTGGDDGD